MSALLAVTSAQFPFNQGFQQPSSQQSYQPQQYQPQPQSYQAPAPSYQSQAPAYQPQAPAYQPQAPAYQPPSQPQQRSYQPAAVHYVNIGKDLAGDYKFGYDTGKGNDGQSFREETRLPDGTVQGAYGYVDASGQQRIIKYTAGKNGYQVEGDGIPKAPAAPAPAQAAPQSAPPSYQYGASPQYNRGY